MLGEYCVEDRVDGDDVEPDDRVRSDFAGL
jgi:hypothetical protein